MGCMQSDMSRRSIAPLPLPLPHFTPLAPPPGARTRALQVNNAMNMANQAYSNGMNMANQAQVRAAAPPPPPPSSAAAAPPAQQARLSSQNSLVNPGSGLRGQCG